jgi:8-amino-7-oxononanoate synthase
VVDGRQVLSFSSNDYLGLASHPALVEAARDALARYGFGAGSSRLIVGNNRAHVELEQAGAAWLGTPAARMFNSGYAANTGVLPVLAGAGAAIFSDRRNHASMIDGCRLARGSVEVFRSASDLEAMLSRSTATRRVIATESVSSMDGDVADLETLRALADEHQAILVVDEAHGVGVFGPRGAGVLEARGVKAEAIIATLGKAAGGYGALIGGSTGLVDLLWNRARPLVFTTGLPPVLAAAATAAVRIIQGPEGEARRLRLWTRVAQLRDGLRAIGLPVEGASPIIPIIVGGDRDVMAWTGRLWEQGIFVQGIRPPTVPEGSARLRIALSADHTEDDVARLVEALCVSRGTSR